MTLHQRSRAAFVSVLVLLSAMTWTSPPRLADVPLPVTAYSQSDLKITSATVPLDMVKEILTNSLEWSRFEEEQGSPFAVYIDPRSGVVATLITRTPLIPGTGSGNNVTLDTLGSRLGRPVEEITPEVVGEAVRTYANENRAVLAIDPEQLGPARAVQVTEYLWQVSIAQQVKEIPVRHGRLVATINHGNLVIAGTESWGNVSIDTTPAISAKEAEEIGFSHVGGRFPQDSVWKPSVLELVPHTPPGREAAYQPGGSVGGGYGHRLAWVFGFERAAQAGTWEVIVDAHTGTVMAIKDVNHYAKAQIRGGVYPLTNRGPCAFPEKCGVMRQDYPMPWADTGHQSAPFANSAGVFDYPGGATITTLRGTYIRIIDLNCGTGQLGNPAFTASSNDDGQPGGGHINLGGANGDHDCTAGAGIPGNTAAARTAYYEANRMAEIARGWLPGNAWVNRTVPDQLPIQVNRSGLAVGCSASWQPLTQRINLTWSGKDQCGQPACGNTGEIATIVDHEWGHGLDDNDANGTLSNTSEGYADIASMYRLQASCVAYGLNFGFSWGCGRTVDLTGFNANESDSNPCPPCLRCPDNSIPPPPCDQDLETCNIPRIPARCDLDCSGWREADYNKKVGNGVDTVTNYVCSHCPSGDGPCGKQVHCAAAPVTQAAWDLATRDLRGPPFAYDSVTAFIIANKLFYQGSGNIGSWYECDCGGGTSSGCGSGSGYMQWLAADDDNGNLLDGTPHITALYNAFHRHEIACPPNVLASADQETVFGGVVPPTNFTDTRTSDDVREVLEEGLDTQSPPASRLDHRWRFDNVLRDVPRKLIVEGYRPSNSEGDNFMFYWSNDGLDWTEIAGAEIKKVIELQGGLLYSFGGPYASTVYIRVQDTQTSGQVLDRVYIDYLGIGERGPSLQNSGCENGPLLAPTLSVSGGPAGDRTLTWTSVPLATEYWVFRTEGHAGCNLGMARIARVTTTSHVDSEVADGRQYFYTVMAAGATEACFGMSSTCQASPP